MGLYRGPVIAINRDDRFDYVGHSVNMAERMAAQGRAGDLVLLASLYERARPATGDLRVERFRASLGSSGEEEELVRARPA
jgi:class 3 adenylate cyclase